MAVTEYAKAVLPEVIGCPRFLVNREIVNAIIKFCKDTNFYEIGFEYDVEDTDVDDTDNYSVTIDYTTELSNNEIIAMHVTEFRIDGALFETQYLRLNDNQTYLDDLRLNSAIFFHFSSATEVKFFGLQEVDQTFYVKMAYYPVNTITTFDSDIYNFGHEAIEALAKSVLMSMPDKAWTNLQMAAANLQEYNGKMGYAKILKSKGFTQGDSRVESVRFF